MRNYETLTTLTNRCISPLSLMESLHWYKSEKFDPNNEDDMYWVETDPEIREYQQLYDLSPKDHILYLVSAEKNAIRYWKVGITEKESAKKRDPKNYLETFRETYHHGETAESIELAIAQMHIEGNSAAASAAASGATAAAFGKLISNLFLGDFL